MVVKTQRGKLNIADSVADFCNDSAKSGTILYQ
jgi:hypothetical protein